VIRDFSRAQGDRIDLSTIDANGTLAGNGAFSFIGTAAFGGTAGQLRISAAGADLLVSGDVNGDRKADFVIRLENVASLAAGDFVL